jgi:hypothetical protein
MDTDDTAQSNSQSNNPLEKTTVGLAIISLNTIAAHIDAERRTNGLGERGRALSLGLTKLDEARLWLKEANLLT